MNTVIIVCVLAVGSLIFLGRSDGVRRTDTVNVQRKYGCIVPTEPLYGSLNFNDEKRKVILVCDKGFLQTGDKVRTCNKRGKWTGRKFNCIRSPKERKLCTNVNDLEHGSIFYSARIRKIGTTVTYSCDSGYHLTGTNTSRCLPGRKWDGEAPACLTVVELLQEKFIDRYAVTTADSQVSAGSRLSLGKSGLDIVLVLDTSASIGPNSLKKAKEFMKLIVKTFGVSPTADGGKGTRVAVITFASNATVLFNLDDPKVRSVDAVGAEIDAIQTTGGGTNFLKALSKVYKDIWVMKIKPDDRRASGATRAVFFITDSEETADATSTEGIKRRADLIKQYDFEIYAIGVGRHIDHVALENFATPPFTEHVFPIKSFRDLAEIADTIAERNIDYGQCGISGNNDLGTSSGHARPNSWPWIGWVSVNAMLSPKSCGGALVCQRYFVTAAHCLHTVNKHGQTVLVQKRRILVYLSDHRLYKLDNTEVMAKVRGVEIHPNYTGDPNEYGVREYDVAILDLGNQTKKQPTLNKQLRPICVATNQTGDGLHTFAENLLTSLQFDDKRAGYVAGWGHAPGNMYSQFLPWGKLKQTQRRVQSNRRCGKKFPGIDTDMFFCVGDVQESEWCRGDVGGPYMDTVLRKQFVMLGLALQTRDCTDENGFSIFLNMLQEDIVSWLELILEGCNRTHKVKVTTDDDEDQDRKKKVD